MPGMDPFGELCRKIVLLIPEDRLVLQHFRPLITLLKEISHAVVVVTRSSGRLSEIEALGARVIDFDGHQSSHNPLRHAAAAWAVGRMLEAEAPDVVHLVTLGSVVLGGLALKLVPAPHVVVQMPGLGALGAAKRRSRLYRAGALRMLASMLRRPASYLLVENVDDLALLRAQGVDPGARFAVLNGGGVDPQAYPALALPGSEPPLPRSWARWCGGMDWMY